MINVADNYKLIELEIDGEMRTERINPSDAWNVFEVVSLEGKKTTIHEGNAIQFVIESGEVITGVLEKIQGKGEKTKLQINPVESECQQIWSVGSIKEDTLKVIEIGEDKEEVEEED